jgi:4-amino-4-deoxy-L-arabinose transferase-like glycosyltransferase
LHELVGTYQRSFGEMWHWALVSPAATPLNFIAQKLVLDAFGFSSFAVRLPAIVFGVASMWIFIRIAREYTASRWPIAVALFALLPQIFRYGVEARPYSQGMFFSLVAFWFWTRLEREPSLRDTIAFGLCVAACLYSQVYSVFPTLAMAAWSLRNGKSRTPVLFATAAAIVSYIPWFFVQRATQTAVRAETYALDWTNFSVLGVVRELSGGGYFCSIPLLVLAGIGALASKNVRLALPAIAAIVAPLAADAVLGYYFAGRQLVFALPFLILLATLGVASTPRWLAAVLLIPLAAASVRYDLRQATATREDWESPARNLASYNCVYMWREDQLQYLRVYERALRQCDPAHLPDEFPYVTTRYSPAGESPKGFTPVKRETIGVAEIVLYRRDASLKTYGLSRFVFRP